MISESYKAVLIGTTGNLLQFKFAVEDKSGNSTGENADCTNTIVNQGVKKTINKIYTAQQGREGIIVELDNYLTEGTNNISINIKGVNSLAATTVSVVYQLVNLKFTDNTIVFFNTEFNIIYFPPRTNWKYISRSIKCNYTFFICCI